jgi:hypothetical protein
MRNVIEPAARSDCRAMRRISGKRYALTEMHYANLAPLTSRR